MGKQTNAQVLRFFKNKDWLSKYYSSSFNYTNLILQDYLIREYVLNFTLSFNIKVAQIYIYREESRIIIRVFSYNDSFTNWKSFLSKHQKKIIQRNKSVTYLSKKHKNILNPINLEVYDWFENYSKLTEEIFFFKNRRELDYISVLSNNYIPMGYSVKRLLSLNLSYLLKTNVILKNTNIISKRKRFILFKMFSSLGLRLKSPLSKYLRIKFICLVYYSLLYKSSLLLCRYLSFLVPRFCKKKRKSRKINLFLKSLKSLVHILFVNNFALNIKGLKIIFKGRINGSRRKRTYIIKKGSTSTQSLSNQVSYYQEDCLTIFGVLGIKVWIIF